MERNLNNWQDLWQQQKASHIDIEKFTQRLLRLEKITKIQQVLFLVVAAFVLYSMATHLTLSIYNICAFLLILIGLLFLLIPLFKNKSNQIILNNHQFIENNLQFLRNKLLIPKVYVFIFSILFVLALNIAFLGAFKHMEMAYRVLWHVTTIILFIILTILRNVGIKKYNAEIIPLIEKLEKIQKQENPSRNNF